MKKIFTVLFLLCLTSVAFAQSETAKRTEEYCQLMATQKFMSTKVIVSVDYGQQRKIFSSASVVKDEEGKIQSFNSVVDALNYMNEQGWEFVNAYVITVSNQNVYHYMMKRKVNGEALVNK